MATQTWQKKLKSFSGLLDLFTETFS